MNTEPPQAKGLLIPENKCNESQTLQDLRKALVLNRQAQERLKQCRDVIQSRMRLIQESISSIKLKAQFPHSTSLLSYIKFERNLLTSYKDQVKISQPQEPKPKKDDEDEFMRKLHQSKIQKKKKELNINDLPSDLAHIDLVEICKGTQFRTGIDVYRAWIDKRKAKQPKRLFTLAEDHLIEEMHQMYGENWQKIGQLLPNRPYEEMFYEYHNRINRNLATGRWNIRQTLMLIILLQHFGAKRWALISEKMKIKSELQVRERYCNLVDPTIGKDIWTYDLEKKLLEIAESYGYCWKKISQLPIFKNKTDNCIWRKFKCLMIRFSEEEIREILANETTGRKLVDKILKEKRIVEGRKRSAKNRPQPPIYFNQYQPKPLTHTNIMDSCKSSKVGELTVCTVEVSQIIIEHEDDEDVFVDENDW